MTVTRSGRHVTTPVTTGQTSNGYTQITHGVTAGEKVVEKVVTFTGTPSSGKNGILGAPGKGVPGPGVHVFQVGPGGGPQSVNGAAGTGGTGGGTGG